MLLSLSAELVCVVVSMLALCVKCRSWGSSVLTAVAQSSLARLREAGGSEQSRHDRPVQRVF